MLALASRQFKILTAHCAVFSASTSLASGFVGAYLLKMGWSLPAALAIYAAALSVRFLMRFVALRLVAAVGYKAAMCLGVAIGSTQFFALLKADDPVWLVAWVLILSLAESTYWPILHACNATAGHSAETRGRELAFRQMVSSSISVLGPMVAGVLLSQFGPGVNFGLAGLLALLSMIPLLLLGSIPAGPVPSAAESIRGVDRVGMLAFAADGWICSGLGLAWPMVLFTSLGSHYDNFGISGAASALVGALVGLACGRGIDRGKRDRYLVIVSLALLAGFVLRAGSGWSPVAAMIANATGAVAAGLYGPVLMSVIYERAKRSGAAYRFHLAAEAGWDMGAVSGALVAAAVAWFAPMASLAVLPAALGVGVIYACVRAEGGGPARARPAKTIAEPPFAAVPAAG